MFSPSDEEYQQTKRIKLERTPLPSPFKELAAWLGQRYHVDVLNIFYDWVIPVNRPRLYVVLDLEADELKFRRGGPLGNFKRTMQDEILGQFRGLISQQRREREFDINNLLVVFGSFESVARIEANNNVSQDEIQSLQRRLNNADLWLIRPFFATVTFFFYNEQQAQRYEAKGAKDAYALEYARIVEPYDQFGYLRQRGILVRFDSKEVFDTKFKGNWFYYHK
jgi:hypothetical protein